MLLIWSLGTSSQAGGRAEHTKLRVGAAALLPLSCQGRLFDLCSLTVSIKTKDQPDMCSVSRHRVKPPLALEFVD